MYKWKSEQSLNQSNCTNKDIFDYHFDQSPHPWSKINK